MKSVLISINPKWCGLIASGKKTIEVRKTKPKIDAPFKCYIYQTLKPVSVSFSGTGKHISEYDKTIFFTNRSGRVIGEFVCDVIIPMSIEYSDMNSPLALRDFPYTCLTDKQIMDYLGNGKQGYGWHISELKLYEKPKPLSEFISYNSPCEMNEYGTGAKFKEINRPPQSWCYVIERTYI